MQAKKYILALILGLGSVITAAFPALPYSLYAKRGQVKAVLIQNYGQSKSGNKKIMVNNSPIDRSRKSQRTEDQRSLGTVGRSDDQSNRADESKPKISTEQWLYQEWDARYGSRVAKVMVAIVKAESGMNPLAVSPTSDYGLHQIHTFKGQRNGRTAEQLKDPVTNLQVAVEIYESQGLNAWSTYNNRRYLKFM